MRVGAPLWDGSAECQGNFAGCVKTILPACLSAVSTVHRLERPVIIGQAVPERSISDQEGPQARRMCLTARRMTA
jgi:hypothetical protein